MAEILTTKNITKNFGKFCALDNISITIEKNSCVGLLGPNGAGKTTLMKILTNLIRPSSGSAKILGFDIAKESKKIFQNVGSFVETPEFFPYMTPNEVLRYFGKLRGISEADLDSAIESALKTVNLENVGGKKIATFSKGMKQRMGIASALLHDPELLILDEPTSGFDPRGKIEMRQIFKDLIGKGKTILISSHQLSEIQDICDSVIIIDKGKLLETKKLNQIQDITSQKIEITLLDSPTDLEIDMVKSLDGVESVMVLKQTIEVQFNGDMSSASKFLKKLNQSDLKMISFNTTSRDLEALYLDNVSDSIR